MNDTVRHSAVQDPPPVPTNRRRLLRVAEVAEMLGLSVRAIWRLTSDGTLPSPVKIGSATRWRVSDLDEFVEGLEG